MNGMDQVTTEEMLPKQAVNYLCILLEISFVYWKLMIAKIAFNHGFLPQTFMFEIELQRFAYNTFGGLK